MQHRIDDPRRAADVARLRSVLRAEILATRDAGYIPEGLAGHGTIDDHPHGDACLLERILDVANQVSDGSFASLPALIAVRNDAHPVVRYWAATGLLIPGESVTVQGPGSGTFFGHTARSSEDARAENMYLTPSNLGKASRTSS